MIGKFLGMFAKGERPSVGDRLLAAELSRELAERVFSPPAEGELQLSGDTAKDAVPLFRYMHGKGRDVVDRFLAGKPAMSERLAREVGKLRESAARVAELLAEPVKGLDDVAEEKSGELGAKMKEFLEQVTVIGEVAAGKRWST